MRTRYFCFITLIFFSLNAFSQIPNNSFEQWTDSVHAEGWASSFSAFGYDIHFAKRTQDAYDGLYAVELTSLDIPIYGLSSAVLTVGQIIPNFSTFSLDIEGAVPVANQPTHLMGYYKYLPQSADTMQIFVKLFKYNAALGRRDTIGEGYFENSNTISSYSPFSMILGYYPQFTGITPDSISITVFSSASSPVAGTKLFLDNLYYTYDGLGLDDVKLDKDLRVYPNPVSDFCSIDFLDDKKEAYIISVYSFTGALQRRVQGSGNIQIDMRNYSTGIYFLKIDFQKGRSVNLSIIKE